MGKEEVLFTRHSPWQRAYLERVIGSIRRECLDHVIVFDEGSLRRIPVAYFDYYHRPLTRRWCSESRSRAQTIPQWLRDAEVLRASGTGAEFSLGTVVRQWIDPLW